VNFRSVIARVSAFVEDLLPENLLQLLFALGTFLLFLGSWRPWLPPHHTLAYPEWQADKSDLWFDSSSRITMLGYALSLFSVSLAALASIALWSLRVKEPIRKFRRWVIAPAGLGVAIFAGIVLFAKDPRISILEPQIQVAQNLLRRFPGRMESLGTGYYLTLAGLATICGALWGFSAGHIPLPIRFRNQLASAADRDRASQTGKNVLALVIATCLLAAIPSWIFFFVWMFKTLPWTWGTGKFPGFVWVESTIYAAIAAGCAVALLARSGSRKLKQLFIPPKIRDAGLAVLVVLPALILPRILQGILQQIDWGSSESPLGFPYSWGELLVPEPFFLLLLVFITALLQETVLRGFLQAQLTPVVGLKRSIFLAGLLWGILPLSYGIHPHLAAEVRLLGLATLVNWGILISYSVVLGWAFARSQSVLPAAMMHGAVLLFHKGSGETIYLNDPIVYWCELGAIISTGWYLFKRYPPVAARHGDLS
jgi:membrane protease YdiL (CAAX protease family)